MFRWFAGMTVTLPFLFSPSLFAETIEPGKTGSELRQRLRDRYSGSTVLSYRRAREEMFGSIDNHWGQVRLVYTGSVFATSGIPDPQIVNTEHTWPQSKFKHASQSRQMKSDLHHLYPTWNRVNAARGNSPFGEIADSQTDEWWNNRNPQSQIPGPGVIDNFSESTPA